MKINIISTHRYHLLDIARELSQQGYDVRFYSCLPRKKCEAFGLPQKQSVSFLWLVGFFFLLGKIGRNNLTWQYKVGGLRNHITDWYVSHTMRRCDILIALGCIYTKSILKAKNDWGAKTILEWGSKHIIEQLKNFNKTDLYPKAQLESDLNEYQIVDYISIPATHVKESFIKHGIPESKLLVNPYGVNLKEFHPTLCTMEYDLITVGGWRYEKGSDLLVEVCRKYKYKLLHVGGLVNLSFPDDENMKHFDSVKQSELIEFYKRAKVFVLPSRSEGLSLVQAQAIACGLPVVCSSETGGIDLRSQITDKRWIIEMHSLDVEDLHYAIEQALALADSQHGLRSYVGDEVKNLSWEAYGKRYSEIINKIIKNESKRLSN